MATAILLPRQGQSVETCIISRFHVAVGDIVTVGTPLFSYETDKATFEEEAKDNGEILALFYDEGDEVSVLTNVGVIGEKGESFEEFRPDKGGEKETTDAESEAEVQEEEPAQTRSNTTQFSAASSSDIFISPRAKKLTRTNGISFENIAGTGPKGRIIEADILKVLANRPKVTPLAKKIMKEESKVMPEQGRGLGQRVTSGDLAPSNVVNTGEYEMVPLSNVRKLIAKAMHDSLQNSAQLTHHLSADAGNILKLRNRVKEAQKEGYEHNLTLNDMICFAVVSTLKKFRNANAHFTGDSIRVFKKVHLGLAVDTERGLMVPAIKNSDDMSIQELSSQMKTLADSCRSGSVDPDLLAPEAASFTVSNLGNYGVEMFTPVINLPQVAILGVNTIIPRPKDLGDGTYGFIPHLGLSLTYDHQALDGGEATRFLRAIADEIETFEIDL